MSNDLERIITELEEVTARLLATPCWERDVEFGELSASRHRLAGQLVGRQDLDAGAAERIGGVIQAGQGLLAPIMAMRQSALDALAETAAQRRFVRELGSTLSTPAETHYLDMKA
jgi:hypothetical protein